MGGPEALGHQPETPGVAVVVPIHDDGDDELAALNAAGAFVPLGPFLAEEAFLARLGVGGNQREKQITAVDGVADLLLPVVAGLQVALVEPGHVGADFLQAFEESASRGEIVARIADEEGFLAAGPSWDGGSLIRPLRGLGMFFAPPPRELGHEFPGTARINPGIRAEAFEEEGEAATAVRRWLDQEFPLAAVVGEPLGIGQADEEPAQPVGKVAADQQQILGAHLRE